jgi:hypothetical protein
MSDLLSGTCACAARRPVPTLQRALSSELAEQVLPRIAAMMGAQG